MTLDRNNKEKAEALDAEFKNYEDAAHINNFNDLINLLTEHVFNAESQNSSTHRLGTREGAMRYALLGEVSTDIVVNLARHFYETNNFTDTNFRETIISGYNEIFFSELKGLIIRRCLKLQDSHIKRIKFVASLDQGECYQHAKAYELLNAHLINSDVTSVNLCKRIDKLMHEVIREDINFAVFIIWKVGQAKGWLETTNQDYSKDWEKYIAQSWE